MKIFVNIALILAVILLAFFSFCSFKEMQSFHYFLAPLAILVSALLAIRTAIMTIESTKNLNRENRTIEYLTKEYPLSGVVAQSLSSAEQKLILGSEKVIKERISRNEMKLDIEHLDLLIQSLKEEESSALGKVLTYYETISINLSSGYFSTKIVNEHLGKHYGVQFWARAWPFVVYSKQMSNIYSDLKGLPKSQGEGPFAKFEEFILSNSEIRNPYPRKGEKMVVEFAH